MQVGVSEFSLRSRTNARSALDPYASRGRSLLTWSHEQHPGLLRLTRTQLVDLGPRMCLCSRPLRHTGTQLVKMASRTAPDPLRLTRTQLADMGPRTHFLRSNLRRTHPLSCCILNGPTVVADGLCDDVGSMT